MSSVQTRSSASNQSGSGSASSGGSSNAAAPHPQTARKAPVTSTTATVSKKKGKKGGNRPFQCPHCPLNYSIKAHLTRHFKSSRCARERQAAATANGDVEDHEEVEEQEAEGLAAEQNDNQSEAETGRRQRNEKNAPCHRCHKMFVSDIAAIRHLQGGFCKKCDLCAVEKLTCDKKEPSCTTCLKRGWPCKYVKKGDSWDYADSTKPAGHEANDGDEGEGSAPGPSGTKGDELVHKTTGGKRLPGQGVAVDAAPVRPTFGGKRLPGYHPPAAPTDDEEATDDEEDARPTLGGKKLPPLGTLPDIAEEDEDEVAAPEAPEVNPKKQKQSTRSRKGKEKVVDDDVDMSEAYEADVPPPKAKQPKKKQPLVSMAVKETSESVSAPTGRGHRNAAAQKTKQGRPQAEAHSPRRAKAAKASKAGQSSPKGTGGNLRPKGAITAAAPRSGPFFEEFGDSVAIKRKRSDDTADDVPHPTEPVSPADVSKHPVKSPRADHHHDFTGSQTSRDQVQEWAEQLPVAQEIDQVDPNTITPDRPDVRRVAAPEWGTDVEITLPDYPADLFRDSPDQTMQDITVWERERAVKDAEDEEISGTDDGEHESVTSSHTNSGEPRPAEMTTPIAASAVPTTPFTMNNGQPRLMATPATVNLSIELNTPQAAGTPFIGDDTMHTSLFDAAWDALSSSPLPPAPTAFEPRLLAIEAQMALVDTEQAKLKSMVADFRADLASAVAGQNRKRGEDDDDEETPKKKEKKEEVPVEEGNTTWGEELGIVRDFGGVSFAGEYAGMVGRK